MIEAVLFWGFIAAVSVQLLFWLVFVSKLLSRIRSDKHVKPAKTFPVSVIICARNEAENLKNCLPAVLEQQYPEFEVLVVDDGSEDATAEVVRSFSQQYSNISLLHLERAADRMPGKKFALSKGIEAAKYDWLLLTDADCIPAGKQWICHMQARIKNGKQIVLGYGPYRKTDGWLNALIRFETVLTAVQYFTLSIWGLPYMGVGRNLLYHRSLYVGAGGFSSHQHIASGDDDLFISEVANSDNTAVVFHPESFVFSQPKETWPSYLRQKRRHSTTGKFYKWSVKCMLGMIMLSHFMTYLLFLSLLLFKIRIAVICIWFGIRLFVLLFFYKSILKAFKEQGLIYKIPVLDIGYFLLYLIMIPALFISNTKSWK